MIPKARQVLKILNQERLLYLPTHHPLHGTHSYNCWIAMHNRCKYDDRYKHVQIQDEWYSFFAFYADLGPAPSYDHTLDRKDNDKGYVRGNVRWATKSEQTRNRGVTIFLTLEVHGVKEEKPLIAWCAQFDVNYETAKKRYYRGWPPYEVIHGRQG